MKWSFGFPIGVKLDTERLIVNGLLTIYLIEGIDLTTLDPELFKKGEINPVCVVYLSNDPDLKFESHTCNGT